MEEDKLDILLFGQSLKGQLAANSHSFPSSENFLNPLSFPKDKSARLEFLVDSSFLSALEKYTTSIFSGTKSTVI